MRRILSAAAGLPLACNVALVATAISGGTPAWATSTLPPWTPPADLGPTGAMTQACFVPNPGPACDAATLPEINAARAGEGVAPMLLPSNYESLNSSQQIFVLFNLERQARGQTPLAALTNGLNQDALQGAEAQTDPPLPAGAVQSASLWAGGGGTPLFDDFVWMYDDGPGGPNYGTPWAHRDEILATYPGSPSAVQVGAAVVNTGGDPASAGAVIAAGETAAPVFTWSSEQRYVPAAPSGGGYRVMASDGGVFAYGSSPFDGSTGNLRLSRPIIGAATTRSGLGYWLVGGDGGVFAFGDAPFLGSMANRRLSQPVVGMASDMASNGYWLVAADGGIFNFGAPFLGSTGNMRLNAPVVGMAATPNGGGYWLVGADGGVFNFGNAPFEGSTGSLRLARPIVGMAATQDGKGYWLVASDGGVFCFGDAGYYGSTGGLTLDAPIVSITPAPGGAGYWLTGADGAVYPFGSAAFLGAPAPGPLNAPAVALTP